MRTKRILIILATLLSQPSLAQSSDIDVLFVFSGLASPLVPNKSSWVNGRQAAVNFFLQNSNANQLDFDMSVSQAILPIETSSMTTGSVQDWMTSPIGVAFLESVRGNNDLVVVVGTTFSDNKCGVATIENDEINILNGNIKFAAAIGIVSSCAAGGALDLLIAHELGHQLHGEHQLLYETNGMVDLQDTEDFMDANPFQPVAYNHAWWNVPDTCRGCTPPSSSCRRMNDDPSRTPIRRS